MEDTKSGAVHPLVAALREHICQCEEPYHGAQPIGVFKCERCGKCCDVKLRAALAGAEQGREGLREALKQGREQVLLMLSDDLAKEIREELESVDAALATPAAPIPSVPHSSVAGIQEAMELTANAPAAALAAPELDGTQQHKRRDAG